MKSFVNFSRKQKNKIIYTVATLLMLVAVAIGLLCGSAEVSVFDIVNAIKNGPCGVKERIFIYVRLPRVLGAVFSGAALAVSGAIIQNVLANKLASPSIIGVNSGAGFAVTLCAALGIYGGWQMSLFSFFGAFFAVMLISLAAKKWNASRSSVILIGVAANALFNAFSDIIITLDSNIGLLSNEFKIGDFSSVTYTKLVPVVIIVTFAVLILLTVSNELQIITLGEESAVALGVNVKRTRVLFLLIAALLAGSAVSIAGLLSFVGLIVPHAVRRAGVREVKHLILLCALFGGGFTALCDTFARTIFAPYEIPVGIIMALLGAPFFIFILVRGKGGHKSA